MSHNQTLTFRPYIPFTLFVPNPMRRIEADLNHLRVLGVSGVTLHLGLPVASVTNAPGLANTLIRFFFNRGTLVVTDTGGRTHTLQRLPDLSALTSVLMGTHPGLLAAQAHQQQLIAERHKLNNLTEGDLAECVLYYPHIPRTVNRLLTAREPAKYHDGSFRFQVGGRNGVAKGDVIATYGDFKLTAPFAGRVEFLGNPRPGTYDWVGLMEGDYGDYSGDTPAEKELRQANFGAVVFPEHADLGDAYAFALRPLRDSKISGKIGNFQYCSVRYSFDNGNVWLEEKKDQVYSLYSVIDMAVLDLRRPGSGIPLPDSLATEPQFRDQLMPYWNFINRANATIRYCE